MAKEGETAEAASILETNPAPPLVNALLEIVLALIDIFSLPITKKKS
jgi:hypothetical protein